MAIRTQDVACLLLFIARAQPVAGPPRLLPIIITSSFLFHALSPPLLPNSIIITAAHHHHHQQQHHRTLSSNITFPAQDKAP